MPDMSSEQIRDAAVRVVEGFLNDKIPLSTGLAKEASDLGMNLEQIKRASEVANTVTHLKLMQLHDDRTVEFPLCKSAEVMASLCTPEAGVEKVAMEKTASAPSEPEFVPSEISAHEKTLHFIKEAAVNEKALETLQDRAIVVQSQLVKLAAEVRKDDAWLDKLSCVGSENFAELSTLISGEVKQVRDFGGAALFKEAQLKQVKEVADLYKEAKHIVAETSRRQGLAKRASTLEGEMTKQAFLGAAATAIGRGLGALTGTAAKAGVGAGLAAGKITAKVAKPLALPAAMVASDHAMYRSTSGAAAHDVWDALQH